MQVPGPIDRDPNPGAWTGFLYLLYDLVWLVAILLTSPWWLGRSLLDRGFRSMVRERLTLPPPALPAPSGRPRVLVHGVSVGEVKAAQSIVSGLSRDHEVVVCASTDTGLQVARQTYPDLPVVRFPLDLSLLPARFLRAVDRDLAWGVPDIDWCHYWVDVEYPGLATWCMPVMRGEEPPLDPPSNPPLSWSQPHTSQTLAGK